MNLSKDWPARLSSLLANTQALLLDFDGLLADSEPFHYKAYNRVFEKYGHSLDPDEYWVEFTSRGKGIQGEIDRYGLKLSVSPEEMREEKFLHYSEYCEKGMIPLFPEASRFLRLIAPVYKVAIASGSWEKDIRSILRHAGIDGKGLPVFGKAPTLRREKPHPDIFLEAARQLEVPPQKCLVVEDALKGLEAATAAGMLTVIIRNPLNEKIDFEGAAVIVPSLYEWVKFLESGRAS